VGAAGAEEAFAIGGESGIVANLDRAIEAALELDAEIDSVKPREVGEMAEEAEGELDGAGAADANAEEWAGLFLDELANGGGHVIEDGLRAGGDARGETDVVEAFPLGGHGGNAEVGASQVDADGEGLHAEEAP
jgi:hypothetical protein